MDRFWPLPEGYPVKLIQVAGTSGKGSTCQFLQAGLSEYGKAGCYVKPHVFDYTERFIISGKFVDYGEITEVWEKTVKPFAVESSLRGDPWVLDHFEVNLLIALHLFDRHHLDWGVVETGIGGRYDPVTALDVEATVLTNVGKDHEEVLGKEHWQRALEKGGICREGVPLFTGDQDERSLAVLSAVCDDVGAPLYRIAKKDVEAFRAVIARIQPGGDEESLLESDHQVWNAALASTVIGSLVKKAKVQQFARRFLAARFVGRFWKIEKGVYADVAHNPNKTQALAQDIEARFPKTKKVFVVGISGPRDPVEVIGPLVRQAKAIVVTTAGFKGQDPESVHSRLRDAYPDVPIHLALDPQTSLSVAKRLRNPGETIIFTGSTYMIDQTLNRDAKLRLLNGTFGWREIRQRPPDVTSGWDQQ
ncbi:MAG: hypothetical protein KGI38_09340 [Thaumarchaeota archaeon]|nr:hypothetical protein [Nitrososphaerota archaeon]